MPALSLYADESAALRDVTRAPLLSAAEENRVAMEIDDARRRLFEELLRCPPAAAELLRQRPAGADPRLLDLAKAVERVDDPETRERVDVLHAALTRAIGRLALHNTRLALSIAKRYLHRGLPLTDLVQEAFLGLLKAARRFEPRRGLKFSTSATWWIRQSVVLALQERGRLVRIPARALETLGRVRRVRATLEQALGREPSIEEIADGSGVSPVKARTLSAFQSAPLSLDLRSDDDATLLETLRSAPEPEEVAPLRDDLRKAMEPLSERERIVMVRRYGMDGKAPETLERIGARVGLTRERVRQIERKAFEKLRFRMGDLGYAVHFPSRAPAP
ncbi:MAG TPA: sigma-70 family RNA polymerase sigma factor [Planctomycetota bacterium]